MTLSGTRLVYVLNQYRSAELRGAGVILRLGRLADGSSVRANFTKHLRDEANHAWLWTGAIQKLGGEIVEVSDPYQARLGAGFGVPRSVEDLLALTLVSERRGVTTYESHLNIAGTPDIVRRALTAVLKDERWHVSWIEAELEARSGDRSTSEALERAMEADRQAASAIADSVGIALGTTG